MNNTALKVLAGLLLLGSIVVAYIGIRLSSPSPKSAATPVAQQALPDNTEVVVVAARAIKAGQRIAPADVLSKGVATPAPEALRTVPEAVGKLALADIPAGATLTSRALASETLASLLAPNERALAVQVDEVAGIGGYAKPGDKVDVLVFLAAGRETNDVSSAQVVLQDARLVSLGDANQMASDSSKREGKDKKDDARERRANIRSAVLAVKEAEVSRLMLAANSGRLRLALRPEVLAIRQPEGLLPTKASEPAGLARQSITLSDIAPGGKKPEPKAVTRDEGIIIQEGSKERRLVKNELVAQP